MGTPDTIKTKISGSLGSVGPVTVAGSLGAIGPVTVAGIPDEFDISIKELPKIQLGLDPVTINPLSMSVAITEIPEIRAHLPADFTVGLSLFGFELAAIRLCGEAQAIVEDYEPNPCEHCGHDRHVELSDVHDLEKVIREAGDIVDDEG